jgi:para-aminobenzoate synthetase component 1
MLSLFTFPLPGADPAAIFAPLAGRDFSLWLDSADRAHPQARHSFVAFDPAETVIARDGFVIVKNRDGTRTIEGDPFAILRERLAAWPKTEAHPDLPFQGGAAGFFGYDLARGIEKLPVRATRQGDTPDMAVGIYDQIVAFNHEKNEALYIVHAESETEARNRFDQFRALSARSEKIAPTLPAVVWKPETSRADYERKIRKVIDYIYAGDIFQANLSQQFTADLPPGFDFFAHYLCLRAVNPAPFAAFMRAGPVTISSASPERFLMLRDRHVETRPIKGTRRRADDPVRDAALRAELRTSAKDRAENVMIVDLLRNDLSKVCEDESVAVPSLCALESFAGLHHLVSTVTGTLRADKDALDLLRACFPGGSITGAPKIRAMEIIEELEETRRGPYCGSVGYIGFDGAMDSSIAIRTLVYEDGIVRLNVGGGIVADSDPAAEYDETMVKAERIFRSFSFTTKTEASRRKPGSSDTGSALTALDPGFRRDAEKRRIKTR